MCDNGPETTKGRFPPVNETYSQYVSRLESVPLQTTRISGLPVAPATGFVLYHKGRVTPMKKIAVRKAGTVRLTSSAGSCYCGGTGTVPVLV